MAELGFSLFSLFDSDVILPFDFSLCYCFMKAMLGFCSISTLGSFLCQLLSMFLSPIFKRNMQFNVFEIC